jgi:integrase
MAGRRPLTRDEELRLLQVVRRLPSRDQALITTQWMTGFRVAEVLSLTVGAVTRNGALVGKIGVAPRHMKGGYGRTRWVPVLPELGRALERYLSWMRARWELTFDLPLFLSRQDGSDGTARALTTESARLVLHRAFAAAHIDNDGRLGTHSLRKTWAMNVYKKSGYNIALLKSALNHSDISVTQRYLDVDAGEMEAAMRGVDFTRGPRMAKASGMKIAARQFPFTPAA